MPRAVVFEAWTNAEHVRHWWDPSGAPLSVCEIDLRPNGVFRWVNRGANGVDYRFMGTYREIVVPERQVFTARTFSVQPRIGRNARLQRGRGYDEAHDDDRVQID
jgi:uncharacterized protein YndB with AHSA1/START domain